MKSVQLERGRPVRLRARGPRPLIYARFLPMSQNETYKDTFENPNNELTEKYITGKFG